MITKRSYVYLGSLLFGAVLFFLPHWSLAATTTTPVTTTNKIDSDGSLVNTVFQNQFKIGDESGRLYRTVLISTLPPSLGTITDVHLFVRAANEFGTGGCSSSWDILPTTQNFISTEVTWNSYSTGNNWSSAGGDFGSAWATQSGAGTSAWTDIDLSGAGLTWGTTYYYAFKLTTESTGPVCALEDASNGGGSGFIPYIEITYTAGPPPPPPPTPSIGFDGFGLWGAVATSTQALITETGVPFWEIALGVMSAFFVLFFLFVGLSRSAKRLLRKN